MSFTSGAYALDIWSEPDDVALAPVVELEALSRPGVKERDAAAQSSAALRTARVAEAAEDRQLMQQAQQGEAVAFQTLVERHQRRAFAIALALVRDENDAREIVQEAFLRVHRSLHSFQGTSSFFTWLYRIVTNLSIDVIRKPGRRSTESIERFDLAELEDAADLPLLARIDGADPLEWIRRSEIALRIQCSLDELPPYHRGVILMREIEGMSYEEMAERMGVSKGTIMSRLFHARQKLQRSLADCYQEHVGELPQRMPNRRPGKSCGA